jgi:hypothetical protein
MGYVDQSPQADETTATADAQPPAHISRLADIIEMLRVAREARGTVENLLDTVPREIRQMTSTMQSARGSGRRLLESETAATLESHETLPGGGRDGSDRVRRLRMMSHLQRSRERSDPLSSTPIGVLRRELNHDAMTGSTPDLRPPTSDLEQAINDLSLPFADSPNPTILSRNHHRHSSLSTSPRVLERVPPVSGYNERRLPDTLSSNTTVVQTKHDLKLKKALEYLDSQIGPPSCYLQESNSRAFSKPLIASSSWLRSGASFIGVQFSPDEHPASTAEFQQANTHREWDVEVVLDLVDYSQMTLAGLWKLGKPEGGGRITTFWTGELIDFVSHSLLTKRWSAKLSDDLAHWRKLEPFCDFDDEELSHMFT